MAAADSGMELSGYRLGKKIRTGPHLSVFLSEDNLGRRIEVACYEAAGLRGTLRIAEFLEEARKTAGLLHENICLLLNAGEEEDVWFTASMAPKGPNLRQILERGGALDPDRVRRVAEGATAALGHLADAGLRHGDLRPESIYLSAGKLLVAPRRIVPMEPGDRDLRYLAPEELAGGVTNIRADLFALGAILYEALSGGPAFPASTREEAIAARESGPPAPPPSAPPELAGLVSALLSNNPAHRPSDPETVGRVLSGEIQVAAPSGTPPPPGAPAPGAASTTVPAGPVVAAGPARPAAPPRKPTGRLVVPGGKEPAEWEILEEVVWLSLTEDGLPFVSTEEPPKPLGRIEAGGLFIAASNAAPHPRVNGSLSDRHELSPGDLIRIGEKEVRFEASLPSGPKPQAERAPAGPDRSSVLVGLGTVGLCIAVVLIALFRGKGVLSEGEEAFEAARAAEEKLADGPEAPGVTPLPVNQSEEAAEKAYEELRAFAAANPTDFDGIRGQCEGFLERYGPTTWGYLASRDMEKNDEARREHLRASYEELLAQAGDLIAADRIHEAVLIYRKFTDSRPADRYTERAERESTGLLEVIHRRYEQDLGRADEAAKAGDYGLALDILGAAATYGDPEVRKLAKRRIEELRKSIHETQHGEGGAESAPPPPDPVKPGPDENPPDPAPPPPAEDGPEEKAAKRTFADAKRAFERERWDRVLELLGKFEAPPLDQTRFARDHVAEIRRMAGHAALERDGYGALFAGKVEVERGRKLSITYDFEDDLQLTDWTFIKAFADARSGTFRRGGDGVRGRGVGAFVHSAVFEPGSFVLEARVQAVKPTDFGLMMLEPKEMIRFFLYSVQNRFFTLGRERSPVNENSIWVFGPGAWSERTGRDIGFVRKNGRPTPEVSAGEWIDLVAKKEKDTMSWQVKKTPPIKGSALGDDNFRFPALEPALYVLGGEAIYRTVTIRGTLQQEWADKAMERARGKLR